MLSVRLTGASPLSVLKCTVAVSDDLDIKETVTATGGPISSNGKAKVDKDIIANLEADETEGSGEVIGIKVEPISDYTMPSQNVFYSYRTVATQITLPGDGKLTAPLLSASVNPFGGGTNSEGIYRVVADRDVTLEISRIEGTLVVECSDGKKVELKENVSWTPHSPDYPILLIYHGTTGGVTDRLQPPEGTVTVGGVTYPSQLNGLVHVMGQSSSQSVKLGYAPIVGTLIVDQKAIMEKPGTYVWDPNLYEKPPIGYGVGFRMRTISGSCRWEAAP